MTYRIPRQRDIIDRKALIKRLGEIVADPQLPKHKVRGEVLSLFKTVLSSGHAEVRRRFETEAATGTDVVRANAFLMDQMIRLIHDFAVNHVFQTGVRTMGEQLSILAVGGYGRGELSPFSDIDLLFLLPYKKTPYSEQIVEYILYMLWDLGLKVGHSTRSIDECMRQAKADVTIRTALLESRWLWGDQALGSEFKARFRKEVIEGTGIEFVEAKLAERDERHTRLGDTRYVLEPNLKEGKGGLRDLQTLFWIANYLYGVSDMAELVDLGVLTRPVAGRFAKAQNFLWTVRCNLHYLTGRLEDRLTFDVQKEIAERMGYKRHAGQIGVERFMRHYFLIAKDVGDLTRILCAVLEENHKRKPKFSLAGLVSRHKEIGGFPIEGGRLTVARADAFEKNPVGMIEIFKVAHDHNLDIHPNALKLITDNLNKVKTLHDDRHANALFLSMMTAKNPETPLHWLNESGVFGQFVPDFGKVVAQMQYDMYHVYTTDEHTIRAIGNLYRLEKGEFRDEMPIASELIGKIQSRRALTVAAFLHDIGKGRGGDHSEIGAAVAKKLCPRLGLTEEETETVAWLVLHHLLMSDTAFKRDVDDPKTIEDFVAVVQSPERLKLLLILTAVDIHAVGPNVWNGWKAGLLRTLYTYAMEAMTGTPRGGERDRRVAAAKQALAERLTDWAADEIEAHAALGYPTYWMAFSAEEHERHARMIRAAEAAKEVLTVEASVDRFHAATAITIYAADHPGLFARIAGGLALGGANIVDAKIFTLANGMALDTFWVQGQDGEAIDSPDKLKTLRTSIEKALLGQIKLSVELRKKAPALPSRANVFTVPPRVIIDNAASVTHTVIEINGRDRVGLLYDLTSALTHANLQIFSAHVSTFGERAVDVFYVKDLYGMKVEHDGKLRAVRDALLKALGGDPDETPVTHRTASRAVDDLTRARQGIRRASGS